MIPWEERLLIERIKRRFYTLGLIVALPTLVVTYLANPQRDTYFTFGHPLLILMLAIALAVVRNRRIPIERVEGISFGSISLFFLVKLALYMWSPAPLEAGWNEVESAYWVLAFMCICAYAALEPKPGLVFNISLIAVSTLISATRWLSEAPAQHLFSEWLRLEVRLTAVALLTYCLAQLKDRLRLAHQRTEALRNLAHTDALTGLPNRRWMQGTLEAATANEERCFVILIDVDRFKSVNDRYGHAKGDVVLQGIAQTLRAGLRTSDSVARWGGEEFLVYSSGTNDRNAPVALPAHGLEQAQALAERLRGDLERLNIPEVGQITASFGVALRGPQESPEDLLERADTAMYAAKAGGRNRVEVALVTTLKRISIEEQMVPPTSAA